MLKLDNLSKTYYTADKEVIAIDKINLDIYDNEIVSVVGPSGCGKSTMLNILGGFEDKTSGEVIFPDGNKKIGYMFQTDCLFPWLTIIDNCLLGIKINGKVEKKDRDYVISLLNNYGLGEFINSYPNNLSGGMRQRVL